MVERLACLYQMLCPTNPLTKFRLRANSLGKNRYLTMTLTKSDSIDSIYNKTGLPENKSTQLVDSVLEIITQTLESDKETERQEFGLRTGNKELIESRRIR
jgi:hypothetical protein